MENNMYIVLGVAIILGMTVAQIYHRIRKRKKYIYSQKLWLSESVRELNKNICNQELSKAKKLSVIIAKHISNLEFRNNFRDEIQNYYTIQHQMPAIEEELGIIQGYLCKLQHFLVHQDIDHQEVVSCIDNLDGIRKRSSGNYNWDPYLELKEKVQQLVRVHHPSKS